MAIGNIVDFWSGRSTAKALGQPIMSRGFRRTISKMGDYTRLMIFALMFDALGSLLPAYAVPFATILCTIAVLCIEGKSVLENSRRKKSHAGDIPEMIKSIIRAATEEQGLEVLNRIADQMALTKKDENK